MLVGWQRLLQQNIYNMFCPVVPTMFVLPLQQSLLDDHLIRICLVKTLPSKKPAGKEKKKTNGKGNGVQYSYEPLSAFRLPH
jgi:hypothetical protein